MKISSMVIFLIFFTMGFFVVKQIYKVHCYIEKITTTEPKINVYDYTITPNNSPLKKPPIN